jgi:FAD/FMN-containing dehydrogenase
VQVVYLNDVHSGANRTPVRRLETPSDAGSAARLLRAGEPLALSGSRHAMGGQQFLTDGIALDTRGLNRVLGLDRERGLLRAEAGIQWPELIAAYLALQGGEDRAEWGIAQKQTGADSFTLGGTLSANAHGRGLALGPIVQDVEEFTLLLADGTERRCSRTENTELFRLAIGGYGLFGLITRVTLRLVRRTRVERLVELADTADLAARFTARLAEGCTYGDFQFAVDDLSEDYLRRGIFTCYRPTEAPVTRPARLLTAEKWLRLLHLAYTDRTRAFQEYARHYLDTAGHVFWADTLQLGPYLPDYKARVAEMIGESAPPLSLMISELYVPLGRLADFLAEAAALTRAMGQPVVYGTIRLIQPDRETFLPWARAPYACVIFNLAETTPGSAAETFRALIDLAISRAGSFYLTYHRHATAPQLRACYPRIDEFLALKEKYDPRGVFRSDWYGHVQGVLRASSE